MKIDIYLGANDSGTLSEARAWRKSLFQELGYTSPLTLDRQGKPSWQTPGRGRPHFNASHSRNWTALAFCVESPVGIDLEHASRIRGYSMTKLDRILHRFFHPQEYAAWRALPDALKTAGFLNLWTQKEAVAKYLGRGLGVGMKSFINPVLRPTEIVAHVGQALLLKAQGRSPWLQSFLFDEDFRASEFGSVFVSVAADRSFSATFQTHRLKKV